MLSLVLCSVCVRMRFVILSIKYYYYYYSTNSSLLFTHLLTYLQTQGRQRGGGWTDVEEISMSVDDRLLDLLHVTDNLVELKQIRR